MLNNHRNNSFVPFFSKISNPYFQNEPFLKFMGKIFLFLKSIYPQKILQRLRQIEQNVFSSMIARFFLKISSLICSSCLLSSQSNLNDYIYGRFIQYKLSYKLSKSIIQNTLNFNNQKQYDHKTCPFNGLLQNIIKMQQLSRCFESLSINEENGFNLKIKSKRKTGKNNIKSFLYRKKVQNAINKMAQIMDSADQLPKSFESQTSSHQSQLSQIKPKPKYNRQYFQTLDNNLKEINRLLDSLNDQE